VSVLLKVKPGVGQKLDAGDNPTFEEWMKRVDKFLAYRWLCADDLPDCDYRTWYANRVRPIRAANRALKNAGGDLY